MPGPENEDSSIDQAADDQSKQQDNGSHIYIENHYDSGNDTDCSTDADIEMETVAHYGKTPSLHENDNNNTDINTLQLGESTSNLSPIEIIDHDTNMNVQSGVNHIINYTHSKQKLIALLIASVGLYIILSLFLIFLVILNILYGTGQLFKISFSNFWCDDTYTIDEIYQINKENADGQGDTNSCYTTDNIVDSTKLFANDPTVSYQSELDIDNTNSIVSIQNFLFCVLYLCCALGLSLVVTKQWLDLVNCKSSLFCIFKNRNNKNKTNNKNSGHQQTPTQKQTAQTKKKSRGCCCGNTVTQHLGKVLVTVFAGHFGVDTRNWLFLKLFSETMEIVLQILVLYQYGGTSLLNVVFGSEIGDTFYTSELPIYIKIFAFTILVNGITTSIFWCLYASFPYRIFGYSFNYALFVNDGIFDSFYCIFPLIIAGGIDSNIISKIGVLQQRTATKFFSTFIPTVLLIRKADTALSRIKRMIQKYKLKFILLTFEGTSSSNTHNINSNTNGKQSTTLGSINSSDLELPMASTNKPQKKVGTFGLKATITTRSGLTIDKTFFIDHRTKIEKQNERISIEKHISESQENSVKGSLDAGGRTRASLSTPGTGTEEMCGVEIEDYEKEHKLHKTVNYLKRLFICCFAILIVFGLSSAATISVIVNLYQSENYCTNYPSGIGSDSNNTELYLFDDYCETKVYKLFDDYPCNCRYFAFGFNRGDEVQDVFKSGNNSDTICKYADTSIYDINEMITKIFKKWTMLERLSVWMPTLWLTCFDMSYLTLYVDETFFGAQNLQMLIIAGTNWQFANNSDSGNVINESALVLKQHMTKWRNMRFLVVFDMEVENGLFIDVMKYISYYMNDLVYLSLIGTNAALEWPDDLCNLKDTLRSLELGYHQIDSIGECIGEFSQLEMLKWYVGTTYDAPIEVLFNLPRIRLISLQILQIELTTLIDQFYVSNGTEFVGYNQDTIEHVYFQWNPLCDVFSSNYIELYSQYPELFDMIEYYNACQPKCETQLLEYLCPPFLNGNGQCDEDCDLDACGYDSGDCNQLCDFQSCDISGWGDNNCDESCNSEYCAWDGDDCDSALAQNSSDTNDGGYDFECPSDCTSISALDDGLCQTFCLNANFSECMMHEYERECMECTEDNAYTCFSLYKLYSALAGTDEVMSSDDWCSLTAFWESIISELDDPELTCNNVTGNPKYDENLNNVIGFHEYLLMFNPNTSRWKIDGIDCSFCFFNQSKYYL